MTLIKICGIQSVEEAHAVNKAGADFMGLNFVPTSKRKISVDLAKEIITSVPKMVKTVGIFSDHPIEDVVSVANEAGLDYIQLHGNESPEDVNSLKTYGFKVIKVFSVPAGFDVSSLLKKLSSYSVDYFMVDRKLQGKGEMLEADRLTQLCSEVPVIVAGGLTPKNVRSITDQVKPLGVDVAGGVETNGRIDYDKVNEIISLIKNPKS